MKGQGLKSQRAEAGVAEVAESQDVEARPVEGEVVEVNEANFLKKIKRKKNNRCLYHIFLPTRPFHKAKIGRRKITFHDYSGDICQVKLYLF